MATAIPSALSSHLRGMRDLSIMDRDLEFLLMAASTSTAAKCSRRKVGAILVLDNRVIATGRNGAPAGMQECIAGACPRGSLSYEEVKAFADYDSPEKPGYCIAVHAEVNAVLHATRDTHGSTMYITDAPCPGCLKVMAAAGVARAVYLTQARDKYEEVVPREAILPRTSTPS